MNSPYHFNSTNQNNHSADSDSDSSSDDTTSFHDNSSDGSTSDDENDPNAIDVYNSSDDYDSDDSDDDDGDDSVQEKTDEKSWWENVFNTSMFFPQSSQDDSSSGDDDDDDSDYDDDSTQYVVDGESDSDNDSYDENDNNSDNNSIESDNSSSSSSRNSSNKMEESDSESNEDENESSDEDTVDNYKMKKYYNNDTFSDLDTESFENDDDDDNDNVEVFVEHNIPAQVTDISVIHSITNAPYYYLLETKPPMYLQTEFTRIDETKGPIDYYLYFYVIVNNRIHPYILTLLEYDTNQKMYNFPKIQYNPYAMKSPQKNGDNNDNDNEDESVYTPSDVHSVEINNLCFSRIADIFTIDEENVHDDFDDDMVMSNTFQYKSNSFISIRADHYTKYLTVPDNQKPTLTNWFFSQSTQKKYIWCSLDEILKNKSLYGEKIHPNVLDLFQDKNNKEFTTIQDDKGETVEIPIVLYPCTWSSKTNTFTTMTCKNGHNNKQPFGIIHHDKHGPMYFFSEEIIDDSPKADPQKPLSRYIVFRGNVPMDLEDSDSRENTSNEIVYTSVRFPYKNTFVQGVISTDLFYEL